jgi:hypothetical protein
VFAATADRASYFSHTAVFYCCNSSQPRYLTEGKWLRVTIEPNEFEGHFPVSIELFDAGPPAIGAQGCAWDEMRSGVQQFYASFAVVGNRQFVVRCAPNSVQVNGDQKSAIRKVWHSKVLAIRQTLALLGVAPPVPAVHQTVGQQMLVLNNALLDYAVPAHVAQQLIGQQRVVLNEAMLAQSVPVPVAQQMIDRQILLLNEALVFHAVPAHAAQKIIGQHMLVLHGALVAQAVPASVAHAAQQTIGQQMLVLNSALRNHAVSAPVAQQIIGHQMLVLNEVLVAHAVPAPVAQQVIVQQMLVLHEALLAHAVPAPVAQQRIDHQMVLLNEALVAQPVPAPVAQQTIGHQMLVLNEALEAFFGALAAMFLKRAEREGMATIDHLVKVLQSAAHSTYTNGDFVYVCERWAREIRGAAGACPTTGQRANPCNHNKSCTTCVAATPIFSTIDDLLASFFRGVDDKGNFLTGDALKKSANNAWPWHIRPRDQEQRARAHGGLCVTSFRALQELNTLYYGMRNIVIHGNPLQTIHGALGESNYEFEFGLPEGFVGRMNPGTCGFVIQLRNLPAQASDSEIAAALVLALPKSTLPIQGPKWGIVVGERTYFDPTIDLHVIMDAHVEVHRVQVGGAAVVKAFITPALPIKRSAYIVRVPDPVLQFTFVQPEQDPNWAAHPVQVGDIVDLTHRHGPLERTDEWKHRDIWDQGLQLVSITPAAHARIEMVGHRGPYFYVPLRNLCPSLRRRADLVIADFDSLPTGGDGQPASAESLMQGARTARRRRQQTQANVETAIGDMKELVKNLRRCTIIRQYCPTKADVLNAMGAYDLVTRVGMMLYEKMS